MADPADIARANEPTAEELALAKQIVEKEGRHLSGCHIYDNPTDWSRPYCSCKPEERIALAAIRETTSLGCAWLESVAAKRSDRMKVEALRTNAHLKDIGHD